MASFSGTNEIFLFQMEPLKCLFFFAKWDSAFLDGMIEAPFFYISKIRLYGWNHRSVFFFFCFCKIPVTFALIVFLTNFLFYGILVMICLFLSLTNLSPCRILLINCLDFFLDELMALWDSNKLLWFFPWWTWRGILAINYLDFMQEFLALQRIKFFNV